MDEQELSRIYAEIAPYLSNQPRIKDFLAKKGKLRRERMIRILEERIEQKEGALRTDYKILLNKLLEERKG